MTSSITAQSHKSPETLEHEIDQQRASISNLVDALESKLTPGQLFDQALSYTRGNGGEFFQNLGTTVKNNPIPTVLATLSLAWLAMNQNRPIAPARVNTGPSLMDRASAAASKVGHAVDSAKEQLRGAADSAKGQLREAADSVTSRTSAIKDKASSWKDGASDRLSDGSDQLNRSAQDLTQQAKQTGAQVGAQVKGQFEYLLQEQPLVLAAVGLALGAAFGAALPSTRQENRLIGKASDNITGQLKAKAQQVKKVVTTEANAVVDAAKHDGADTMKAPYKGKDTDLSQGLGTHH
ncbi:DUF3618 domain-containing protein [Pseudomonas sp. RIT-PI-S]|uniref:DUF3618 domain-containing protein n=1 Tax=Pseudomonas sp. RIT-PI-S TaxID=3035295 RepID=UPI0021D890DF|nr:DUF3618 domain-containing protein [Pseudomonas sp. RIT-PI-S]